MKMKDHITLPAHSAALTEAELLHTEGGSALESAAKGVLAVGVSAALVCVGFVAARTILRVFDFEGLRYAAQSAGDWLGSLFGGAA